MRARLMLIRLPYVFELDYVVHRGHQVRSENVRSYLDVEVPYVEGLGGSVVLKRDHAPFTMWGGRLYRACGIKGDGEFLRLPIRDRPQRGQRRPPEAFPIPPYMRTRRMAFASPVSERFQPYQGIPLNASIMHRHGEEERAQEAREFYQRAFLSCEHLLWMLVEEPVWQIRTSTTAERRKPGVGYSCDVKFDNDFRYAHRQFRLDRMGDAKGFVEKHLKKSLLQLEDNPYQGDPAALARSDVIQLTACTLEFLTPLGDELDLSGLFALKPAAVAGGIEQARALVRQQDESKLGPRDLSQFQILRERWAFEDARPSAPTAHMAWVEPDTTPELDDLRL